MSLCPAGGLMSSHLTHHLSVNHRSDRHVPIGSDRGHELLFVTLGVLWVFPCKHVHLLCILVHILLWSVSVSVDDLALVKAIRPPDVISNINFDSFVCRVTFHFFILSLKLCTVWHGECHSTHWWFNFRACKTWVIIRHKHFLGRQRNFSVVSYLAAVLVS